VVIAGHQQVTQDWWRTCRERFDLCASQLVLDEAGAGDAEAAEERLAILSTVDLLAVSPEASKLAQELVAAGAVPAPAAADALHLAVAAVHRVDYLVTWNCRHLANATMRGRIEAACKRSGFASPVICTPEELLED
jgi:hypothetical protein